MAGSGRHLAARLDPGLPPDERDVAVATAEQRRRVAAMAQVHSRYDRRRVWMEFDARLG